MAAVFSLAEHRTRVSFGKSFRKHKRGKDIDVFILFSFSSFSLLYRLLKILKTVFLILYGSKTTAEPNEISKKMGRERGLIRKIEKKYSQYQSIKNVNCSFPFT